MRFALALSLTSWCLLGIAHAQDQPNLDLEAGLSDTALAQELANPIANLTSVPSRAISTSAAGAATRSATRSTFSR
jgi:hypothetical protein